MTARGLVCIMAKAPTPGLVKTRLAPALGALGAAHLARAFLVDVCARVSALPDTDAVLVLSGTLTPDLVGRVPMPMWDQGDGDLGYRLERAFSRALARAPWSVTIGTDSPDLPDELLASARTALATHDAVLGPSHDGGFYLLGLRRCPPGLLAGLPWSSPETCRATFARLRAFGLSAAILPTWFDVDEPGDLARLEAQARQQPRQLPETAAQLRRPRISVIVPVLDEERRVEALLSRTAALQGLHELVVVDGGSRDHTRTLVGRHPGVRLLESAPGRARQLNRGAAEAIGDVLLFLHADAQLPSDAAARIERALADPAVVAGAFRTWTVADEADRAPGGAARGRAWLAPLLHLADLRSRYSGLPYGDQALFVRTALFRQLGGFAEVPLMEDLELARRLRSHGRIHTVDACVRVSGRRFLARPLAYTVAVNVFPLLYRAGVSPAALARFYRHVR